MKKKEVFDLFKKIKVWKRGAQRAPHKSLLLLYALGKCQRREERLIPFTEIDKVLRPLLIDYGPPRKSFHTEYPFWRLQHDGIWELPNSDNLERRKSSTDAKKSELLKRGINGGFKKQIYRMLHKHPELINEIALHLLNENFPFSMHEEIIKAVNLDLEPLLSTRAKRDPAFRSKVLIAYEYRCAICGYNLQLDNSHLGIEAAHIKWHMAGGPDMEQNGIALCVLHHKMFDRGAFTISDDYSISISQHVYGTHGLNEWLLRYDGNTILKPQSRNYLPGEEYLKWHWSEVFRKPIRQRYTIIWK